MSFILFLCDTSTIFRGSPTNISARDNDHALYFLRYNIEGCVFKVTLNHNFWKKKYLKILQVLNRFKSVVTSLIYPILQKFYESQVGSEGILFPKVSIDKINECNKDYIRIDRNLYFPTVEIGLSIFMIKWIITLFRWKVNQNNR